MLNIVEFISHRIDEVLSGVRSAIAVKVFGSEAGYYIEYGVQFEAQEGAAKTWLLSGILALVAIAVILYFAVKSIPATIIILINLPLALIIQQTRSRQNKFYSST